MSIPNRLRAAGHWMRTHPRRTAAIVAFTGFALLNAWAYRHAWAMTHYTSGGRSTIRPEKLPLSGGVAVLLTGLTLPRRANDKPPADAGLPYETHLLTVPDGIELEAWHVPHSDPRAIVVMFHGYG